jgi:hypothetical protein
MQSESSENPIRNDVLIVEYNRARLGATDEAVIAIHDIP